MRKAAAAAAPADVASAVALADLYYRMAQAEGDPRYLGYAQATLARWWNDAEAPTAVLVTRATIRQSSHEFDAAVADLSRAIARDPRNGRALLVRATVRTVQGRYEEARADCARLAGLVPDVYVVACRSSVDSLTGKAQEAFAALQRAQAEFRPRMPARAPTSPRSRERSRIVFPMRRPNRCFARRLRRTRAICTRSAPTATGCWTRDARPTCSRSSPAKARWMRSCFALRWRKRR